VTLAASPRVRPWEVPPSPAAGPRRVRPWEVSTSADELALETPSGALVRPWEARRAGAPRGAANDDGAPLAHALRLAALGWPVLPIWPAIGPDDATTAPSSREMGDDGDELLVGARCACPKGEACRSPAKHPIAKLAPNGSHDATADEQTLRAWWAEVPGASVGLALAGLVVVDVDPRNGGDRALAGLVLVEGPLPPTPHAFTGGGGDHYLFRAPTFELRGKPWPGVDIKTGPGAYIVAAPSKHASGGRYVWAPAPWSVAPSALPLWLLLKLMKPADVDALRGTPAPRHEVRVNATAYARRAIESACRRILEAPRGTRSDLATREAFTLGRFVKSGEVSAAELVGALFGATRSAGWDNPEKTADTIARSVEAGAR
jgi:hypothetical protein